MSYVLADLNLHLGWLPPDAAGVAGVSGVSGGDGSAFLAAALIALGVSLGAAAMVRLLHRDRREQGPIYRSLCRALHLGRGQRRLVTRIARAAGASSPASLLISRGCFERAAHRYPVRRAEAQHLATIRSRVFES